jgi:uncharacterized protein YegP (UPF0339 family)
MINTRTMKEIGDVYAKKEDAEKAIDDVLKLNPGLSPFNMFTVERELL